MDSAQTLLSEEKLLFITVTCFSVTFSLTHSLSLARSLSLSLPSFYSLTIFIKTLARSESLGCGIVAVSPSLWTFKIPGIDACALFELGPCVCFSGVTADFTRKEYL